MSLNNLRPIPGSRPKRVIVGRGEGSTLGQTCGKGQKGQKCRTGETIMVGFEGGQMPLVRRIPKRGFNHASKIYYHAINLSLLETVFEANAEINAAALAKKGILRKADLPFKILADGKVTKAFKISGQQCSKPALEALKKVGGSFTAVK